MREPPAGVTDDEVLAVVRARWRPDADSVEHLPVGFGAHHWAAYADRSPSLFVTLDTLGGRHDADSLEATYAAASALDLDFVVASLPTLPGTFTVPFADGALSATAWVDGRRPAHASGALALVRRLQATEPPPGVPRWQPLVPPSFGGMLATRVSRPWTAGPHGAAARAAILERLDAVAAWLADYHRHADAARRRPWVLTHGEPHERNQLLTRAGLRVVDWESLRLAPAERDLRWLGAADAEPDMVELFDLEWRLDEIAQYAAWFESPHGDGEDDRVALDGLRHELSRP